MPDREPFESLTARARRETLERAKRRITADAVGRAATTLALVLSILAASALFGAWTRVGLIRGLYLGAVLVAATMAWRGQRTWRQRDRERIARRRRWRVPVRWPGRRARAGAAPTGPRRTRGPLGGRWASQMPASQTITFFVLAILIPVVVILIFTNGFGFLPR